jgi:nitrogen-specific signal transduction histidine kinase
MGKPTVLHKKWRPRELGAVIPVDPKSVRRKKLQLIGMQKNNRTVQEVVLDSTIHELQNCLQSIGMGVDLLQLNHEDELEHHAINNGIERASRLLREMQEYFFSPEPALSTKNLREVLEEAVQKAAREWACASIRFQGTEPFPSVSYDWSSVSRILDRILRCACGLMSPEGGETVVSVRLAEETLPAMTEIKVEVCSAHELPVDEGKLFTPCCRVNDYQTGLGLVLARQAVQSRKGALIFKKVNASRVQFLVRLALPLEDRLLPKTDREAEYGYIEG